MYEGNNNECTIFRLHFLTDRFAGPGKCSVI